LYNVENTPVRVITAVSVDHVRFAAKV